MPVIFFLRIFYVAFAVILAPSLSFAAPDIRLGVVDLQKVLSGSKTGTEAQKKYEQEVKQAQSQVDGKKKELQGLKDAYKKQSASLNAQAKQTKEEEIIRVEKDLKRNFQDSQEKLRRENQSLVGDLVKKVREIVARIGKEDGLTLILEKNSQSVLYADNATDITDRVIKQFDGGGN